MSIAVIHHYPTIMKLFYFTFILSCITGAPVPVDNFYNKFIETLINKKCKMPKEIKLPLNLFNSSSDPEQFGYLSAPLNECQKAEALQKDTEPHLLCREVFEVLRNITCLEYKSPLPEIKTTLLHDDVCSEFTAMKDIFPQGEYIAPRLVDGITCKLLCSDKFESLCQTLVWSYYVQAQINDVFETTEHKDRNEIANEGLSAGKGNANIQKKNSANEEPDNINDLTQIEVKHNKNPSVGESNMENAVTVSPNFSTLISISQIPSHNSDIQNQNPDKQDKNLKSTTEKIKAPVATKLTVTEKQSTGKINEMNGAQENKDIDLVSKSKSKNVNLKKEVKDIRQPGDPKSTQHPTDASNDQTSNKDASGSISPDIESNKASESVTDNMQGSIKSANPISSNDTPDNKINNFDNHKQENEAKGKEPETILKNPDEGDASNIGKISDDTKEASPGIPSMIPSETDSKLEFTTSQILLEDTFDAGIPPDGEDPETYPDDSNELLNDDEFSETEHDKTPSKTSQEKIPKDESSVHGEMEDGISSDGSNNDLFMNSRKSVDIPIMGSFPEQEDSHFFFYFLSIVLILMAGYLIFHNKQKIIALIVEGRHERSRRRSHGAGYKKLETK